MSSTTLCADAGLLIACFGLSIAACSPAKVQPAAPGDRVGDVETGDTIAGDSPTQGDPVATGDTSTSGDVSGSGDTGATGDTLQTGDPTAPEELGFPRTSVYMIGSRFYMDRTAEGQELRDALAKLDHITVGLFPNGPWDTGDSGHLQRAEFYDEIHAKNPKCVIVDYTDLMEANRDGSQADTYYGGTGPTGAETHWVTHTGERTPPTIGSAVNDWWGRQGSGEQKSTFGSGNIINTNITHYVTPNNEGKRVPQVYGDRVLANHLDNIPSIPKDISGIGIYGDVMDNRPKSSTIDFNGDGANDNARADYRVEGSIGKASADAWRQGYADYAAYLRARYPDLIYTSNGTTYSREYSGTDMTALPPFPPEYVGILNGAIQEGQSLRPGQFPFTGVYDDGSDAQPGFGEWQIAYNGYVQLMENTIAPRLVTNDWHIDISPARSTNPGAGTPFHLCRWGLAMTLMDDGYCGITDTNRQYGTVPLLDEYGLSNEGTTGLSKGWLGLPIDAPQRAPRYGTIWWREFDNGIAILNSDNDGSHAAVNVDVSLFGRGLFRRISGAQDPSFNDGTTVTADFALDPKDAIVLERI